MEDGPIAFEQVVVAMKSEDEMLLAFMGAEGVVALLTCSRDMAEVVMKAMGSALDEK